MSAVLALQHALSAGARVFVRDGRLVVQSDGPLSDEVMAELQQHRDRLIEILLMPTALQPVVRTTPSTYMPWLDPKLAAERVWYPGLCGLCGRPMHDGDYVCPVPEPQADDESIQVAV